MGHLKDANISTWNCSCIFVWSKICEKKILVRPFTFISISSLCTWTYQRKISTFTIIWFCDRHVHYGTYFSPATLVCKYDKCVHWNNIPQDLFCVFIIQLFVQIWLEVLAFEKKFNSFNVFLNEKKKQINRVLHACVMFYVYT